MTIVLDSSALLAYLQGEPGEEIVDGVLSESVISSVNWAEVVQKLLASEVEVERILNDLLALGLIIESFTPEDGVKGSCRIVYQPDNPLPCGAVVWIEVLPDTVVIPQLLTPMRVGIF